MVVDEQNDTSHITTIQIHRYHLPPSSGESEIIDRRGENFIGLIDEFTILKYPCIPAISKTPTSKPNCSMCSETTPE